MSNEPKTTVGTEEKTYYHGGKAVARKFAFASGELVYNLPWMLVSSYLAFFMTDVALIPASAVSILFLICRIWDAINDPMIGSLADRTNTKMGRYRPWMLGGALGLIPLVVLLFWAHPGWSVGARTAYGCILYFITVVASTSWNIPFSALNGVISPYPRERASFSSYRIFISSIACSVATALFIPFVTKFSGAEGNTVRGYLLAALVICCMAIPFVFTSILGTKEVVKAPPQQKQKFHAKELAACFTKNPPLLIVCFAFLVYGFLNYGRMTVGMYYLGRCQPVHAVRDRQRPDLRRGCVLQRGSGQALPRQARRAAALLWPELHSEHHPVLPLPGKCIFHARARAPVRHRHLQRILHRAALRHDRRHR